MNYIFFTETTISFLISLICAAIIGPMVLPMLSKLKFGQTVREDGPQSHLIKNGTPTMGGIIFILSTIIAIAFTGKYSSELAFALSFMLLFGFVGFLDDYIKVVLKRSLGLRAYQKIILQFGFALILSIYHLNTSPMGTELIVPFFNDITLDLKIFYVPFLVFVIVAITNSVNLTDGLDGLASSVTFIVALFFMLVSGYMGYGHLSIFMAAVAGGCLGFLRVNRYPARVFMGDTGSMALGGAIAAAAVILNISLIVPIVGFIYFAESLSVIIQVISFKFFKKRVFKMSPIHHHFELSGWKETKVVKVFYLTTFILCIIGLTAI
ncbi:phospho-N-acetylmuramoyl-pentapeptide-transferase [Acetoanaerobium pronyense]|uniref:Phospho-N-acetylmuramoyl-pentapeptide-transferase n=1 Tax=Acetoanaerobium pronyense TaxID=1482736 RepID=A0ABS4KFV9_9FIRM|nr:phospho-N-acetylmuramoyl-pentapeptide-transferase [Acetoanaerobium pronyense]MBP2026672.1 phospho-N-acetylmuramoyl-pentapeptide-transferase [Acetoanaerobium pronyense]